MTGTGVYGRVGRDAYVRMHTRWGSVFSYSMFTTFIHIAHMINTHTVFVVVRSDALFHLLLLL